MDWGITIRRVDNGYIARYPDFDDEEPTICETVFAEDEQGRLETARSLLYHVLEYFGICHSKHNKQNIVVRIEPNDPEQGPG
jgi:hypothetical protein